MGGVGDDDDIDASYGYMRVELLKTIVVGGAAVLVGTSAATVAELFATSLHGIVTGVGWPRIDGMIVVKLTGTKSVVLLAVDTLVINCSAGELVVGSSLDDTKGAFVVVELAGASTFSEVTSLTGALVV